MGTASASPLRIARRIARVNLTPSGSGASLDWVASADAYEWLDLMVHEPAAKMSPDE
jgi:hypothetical protein